MGRLDIPEGQKQSGWRGFNKELTLLLHPISISIPILIVNKGAEENTTKRIPAKERLGPAVSYADSLRIPVTEKLIEKGKTLLAHNPTVKSLKPTNITQTNDKGSEKKEGKAKFLGVQPFRRSGTDTVSQNLKITISAEGKRTFTWDR